MFFNTFRHRVVNHRLALLVAVFVLLPCIGRAREGDGASKIRSESASEPAVKDGGEDSTAAPSEPAVKDGGEDSTAAPSEPAVKDGGEDSTAAAKRLFEQGLQMMAEERWNEAEQLFRRSNDKVRRPSSTFNLVLCLMRQGRIVEGIEVVSELEDDSDLMGDEALRRRIALLRAELKSMVGTLEIDVKPASALIMLDQKPTIQEGATRHYVLNPGKHALVASEEGFADVHMEIVVELGKRQETSIRLAPAPLLEKSAPVEVGETSDHAALDVSGAERHDVSGPGAWPWIAFGVGGAALVSAGITALAGASAESDREDICPGGRDCNPADKPELDRLTQLEGDLYLATDIALLVGLVAGGTGMAMWLLAEDDKPGVKGEARIGRQDVELRLAGRF